MFLYALTIKQKIWLFFAGALILLNIFVWREVFHLENSIYLKVNFLDIGQGDAIFIETPKRHQILIDGGPSSAILGKLQNYMPFWDRKLDVVILTNPDSDHYAGLLYVLQKYKVDYILWTGVIREGQEYQKWVNFLKEAEKNGTKIIKAKINDQIKSGKITLTTLHPYEDLTDKYVQGSVNETSIISRLVFNNISFLFTGDTISKIEKELVKEKVDLTSNVLKVAHHGSKTSTSQEFLAAVNPQIAIISAGKNNRYGHPASDVLQILQKSGINILRTDINGDIKIISDGQNIKITSLR